jgi:hypothetical protein
MINALFAAFLTMQAPTLPATVKFCIAPDASATAPVGYVVTLDGGAPGDIGMPAQTSCKDFVGGATANGVPFAVQVPSTGPHTVSIAGYNLVNVGPATSITFTLPTSAPGAPAVRVTK